VEAREERWVPAVTAHVDAFGTLTVTGDDDANAVAIIDNGTNANGNIRVKGDGVNFTFANRTVTRVNVNTLGDNDVVVYQLSADLQAGAQRTVNVNLGSDDDAFIANVVGDIQAGANLQFFAKGPTGRDGIVLNAFKEVDVAAGARLGFQAFGLEDRDFLRAFYAGRNQGTVDLRLNGGDDSDDVRAIATLRTDSNGQFVGRVNGQGDNDAMALLVFAEANANVDAVLNGGTGFNFAFTTRNVVRVNV